MIYKLESEDSTLINNIIKFFQKQSLSFIYSNGVIYLNTDQQKLQLINSIITQFPESTGNFYIQLISENKIDKLIGYSKTWAKGIISKQKLQQEILDNINLYESYLNHLEEGLAQGNFLIKEEVKEEKKENDIENVFKEIEEENESLNNETTKGG